MSNREHSSESSERPLGEEELVSSSPEVAEDEDEPVLAELLFDEPVEEAEVIDAPDELDVVRAERDEYLDALRRLQAEFDNYRKRTVRQQTELLGRASESLIERLLPVLDALDLALAHGVSPDATVDALVSALQQISALGRDTLGKEGLERIDTAGVVFDPTIHDAVAHLPRSEDDPDSGVVVDEVLRAGYQLKGRVLRPAMVRVRG